MNDGFNRLHGLRMENDAAGFEMDSMRSRFDALRNREPSRAVSAWQLFQTPPDIAEVLCYGIPSGSRVLEPSAGLGRILDALPAGCDVTACDINADCCAELYKREGVKLLQRDFLTIQPGELFDFVVMNPPFHMRADIKHIEHALTFLKPGGSLRAICMDTRHRVDALMGISSVWSPLPAGTFKAEGTKTDTVFLEINI